MSDPTKRLIEQRLLRRAVMHILAEPLIGQERDLFLSSEEEKLNASLPRPSKAQMRSVLKIAK